MANLEEYAFLSDYVYKGHRSKINRYEEKTLASLGWREVRYDTDNPEKVVTDEFVAVIYKRAMK